MSWQNVVENILRDLRLSIYDVERETGVSNVILHKLRTGKTLNPTQNTIKKLEDGLKIKIDDRDLDNITYKKLEEKPLDPDIDLNYVRHLENENKQLKNELQKLKDTLKTLVQ